MDHTSLPNSVWRQSALNWSPTEHSKHSKHVDVRYHIFREATLRGEVKLEYSTTSEMMAYMLTKLLGLQQLSKDGKFIPSIASQPSANDKKEWSVCRDW